MNMNKLPEQKPENEEIPKLTVEERDTTRKRAGFIGRMKKAGKAEKLADGRWEFSEDVIEKAREEMGVELGERARKEAQEKAPPYQKALERTLKIIETVRDISGMRVVTLKEGAERKGDQAIQEALGKTTEEFKDGKDIDEKKFIRTFISHLPGEVFPGIEKLKNEDPQAIDTLVNDLIEASESEDKNKVDELIKKYNVKGEAEASMKELIETSTKLKTEAEQGELTPEERKKKTEELKEKMKKIGSVAGLVGLVGLLALLSIVAIALLSVEVLNRATGKGGHK